MYLVIDEGTNEAAVVDPWDHEQITQKAKDQGVKVGFNRGMRCHGDK